MAGGPFLLPDVLVLAAGGTVGEAWMTGVLAGIEESSGVDFRRVDAFLGTSAGSIVAAGLAAGRSPRRPRGTSERPAGGGAMAGDAPRGGSALLGGLTGAGARMVGLAGGPLAGPLLAASAPGAAVARTLVLARLPAGRQRLDGLRRGVSRSGARFDGRLRVATVDRRTGRRVVFGAPGAPRGTVADAVAASCAIPGVFAPVRIGDREYVDGGVWSPTNLDAAPAGRDTDVLCVSVWAAGAGIVRSAPAALRAVARAPEALETLALRRRGAHVRTIGPDADAIDDLGPNLMDARRADRALAAGYRQGIAIGRRGR